MKRSPLLLPLVLVIAACTTGSGGATTTTTTAPATTTTAPAVTTTTMATGFPVTVEDDDGPVTIEDRPEAIVSLSATATEMLFAIDAGEQVVAVDEQSNHPAEAPRTELSGFTPNLEAILAYEPDLVVISFDPADSPIRQAIESVGVPVLMLGAAVTIDDVYRQIEVLGEATGNVESADALNQLIDAQLATIVAESGDLASGVTYYHELDPNLFTVTSSTFIGEIYSLLGMVNIADAADPDGESGGYPQLSAEYVVAADPQIIYLADANFGESLDTLAARPGWDAMQAVRNGAVVPLDADIASRWGPRIVDFLRAIADGVGSPLGGEGQ